MQLSFSIKFNGGEPYQMHEMEFIICDEDLPEEFVHCNGNDKLIVGQFMLIRQGIVFRLASGNINSVEAVRLNDLLNLSVVGTRYREIKNAVDKVNTVDPN